MKIQEHYSNARNRWLNKPILAKNWRNWLIDDGSLTTRLKSRYSQFNVKPVLLHNAKPNHDEAALLHLSNRQTALIREVLLMGDNQAVVFAHSVLPHTSLGGLWRDLGKLGNQPLGATLFANPKVKRTPLEYKKLKPQHDLYDQATQYLDKKPAYLWARRSVFSLNCANILVTEVFLPNLLNE